MQGSLPPVIIDAHHHIFGGMAELGYPDYEPGDYLRDAAPLGSNLRATVFAECNTHYDAAQPPGLEATGETRFAARLGARFDEEPVRCASAIIGFADPFADLPFEKIVDAQVVAGDGRLRAIRRSTAWDEDAQFNYPILKTLPHMMRDERFCHALHVLAQRDLVFDAWLYHPQFGELVDLAKRVPDCTIVLDHAGMVLSKGRYADSNRSWSDWRDGIARLAERPNLNVKIGVLASIHGLDEIRQKTCGEHWTGPALAEHLAPWLDHLVCSFGPERCLFESNFPIDKAHCDFATIVEAFSLAFGGLGPSERNAIFAGNAARIYKIDLQDEGV
ncbi:amidohydrolase family protein [Novosphingobium taihuense]|uniref:amidohydrolase family protein n=1 Tax=Novosphingobium taihuense TaxID=260085 RepID=UPI0013157C45|nr:amidohydrolase family protein [Novosphingobium taihuense]